LTAPPLIHIGYHKTGTTWLQHEFFAVQPGIYMVPRDRIVEAFVAPGAFSFDPQRARRIVSPPGGERLLISMEALSGYPHNAGLNGCLSRDMVRRLHEAFADAEIIVMLRSQPEIIAAAYAQYVRCGGTYSAGRYTGLIRPPRRPDKSPRFSFDHFEFLPLLRLYRDSFGAQSLHVFLYERLRAEREAFVRQLAAATALEAPSPRHQNSPRRNASYRPGLLRLARVLGRFSARDVAAKPYWIDVPGAYWLQRGLTETLHRALPNRIGSDPERVLGATLVAHIRDRYAESNRRLAAEFGLPLNAYDYPGW